MREACVALIALALIAPPASGENVIAWLDNEAMEAVRELKSPAVDLLMDGITELGDERAAMGISLLLSAFGEGREREAGKLNAVSFALTGGAVFILKRAVGRERPDGSDRLSFPSGHAAFTFSSAVVLGSYYPRLKLPLYALASLVTLSRVYLERHYPSDVLAGAIIGTISARISLALRDRIAELSLTRFIRGGGG